MKYRDQRGGLAESMLAAKRAQRACPHCRAGDPFFDTEHREHVIRTEAGCGVTACLANSGEVAQ
jgi:hypothetical protein